MHHTFGRTLRAAREHAGLTLRDVAEHLHVSIAYVSDVERSNRAPFDDRVILQLAAYLGTDADALLAAAGESRGAFELDATSKVSKRHREVGAVLARSWSELSPEQLEEIHDVLAKKGKH